MTKILIVDDKQMMRDSVGATLMREGFTAVAAETPAIALDMVAKHRPAAVVTDLKMPGMDGLELLQRIRKLDPELPVILMTAYATIDTAVEALKLGAFDYIQKPFEGDDLIATVQRAVRQYELVNENAALKNGEAAAVGLRELVGQSTAMQRIQQQIRQIAPSHGTVLISGESGTGKEIVAHTVHAQSLRRDRVMLCLNCAALSTNLLESELFGHEKGAFTGADAMRKGRFELADGGTLLLDEISEISPQIQAKLLRVLQERQFERVGSSVTMSVDVRVIATTNRDLAAEARAGRFRQDLYFRLNVLPVALPPLRARRSDIVPLAEHFLNRQAQRDGRQPKRLDEQAKRMLEQYDWPGNVRELGNICERAAVLSPGPLIGARILEPWLSGLVAEDAAPAAPEINTRKLEDMERDAIVRALGRFNGNRRRTAEALGIGVRTLGLKLKKWKESNLVAATM